MLILLAVFVIGAVIGTIYYLRTRNFETTDDAFIDGHVIQVSPKIAAHVTAVHFTDNSEVRKGDLLVELDPRDYETALERAKAQLGQARAQVRQALAQMDQAKAQVVQAESQVAQQEAQFEVAGINFNRNKSLFQKDVRAVAKEEVDTTKASFDAQKAMAQAARANAEAIRASVEAAEAQAGSASASARVAEAVVHDAELQLSYTRIQAAVDGRIVRKSVDTGDYVQMAQAMCSLVLPDVWVTANFKETQLTRMRAGQPVRVKVDAFPSLNLKAHVDSFQLGTGSRFSLLPAENATGNFVKVVQRVPVKIVFDEPLGALLRLAPGMSVEPKIDVSGHPEEAGRDKP